MTAEKGIYEVVWPRGKKAGQPGRLAQRLDTLEGKVIGELWDRIFKGEEVFPALEQELARRYPGVRFVNYEKFGYTLGAGEPQVLAGLPAKLHEYHCDAVISGVGC